MRDDEPMSLDDDEDERPRRRSRPPVKKKTPAWVWVLVGVGGLLLLPCGGVVALVVWKAAQKPPTYATMTPDELADEWQKNPAAAQEKYTKNGVEITGRWTDTGKTGDGSNQMVITVTGTKDGSAVSVYVVDDKAKQGLARCKVGGRVTIKARTTGNVHKTPLVLADEIAPAD